MMVLDLHSSKHMVGARKWEYSGLLRPAYCDPTLTRKNKCYGCAGPACADIELQELMLHATSALGYMVLALEWSLAVQCSEISLLFALAHAQTLTLACVVKSIWTKVWETMRRVIPTSSGI